ncbi:MAG: patatin-like phospholipase family protein, partial [Bacteroidetes bacterium]|nr:patatin-like phospholipase family protein [Bacteroidota bacterium]
METNLPVTTEKTVVGLTLSGGGMRGIGHLGVIKALEEVGLKPSVLSGSSAGAIIACFYSAGYAFDDLLTMAETTNFFSYSNIHPRTGGWFGTTKFAN